MAAVDLFLKLDGIAGESQDAKHKGEIDLESFSWGATNQGAAGPGGGGGAGQVSMQAFHFTMRVNKASPALFLACASGKHLKEGVLTARKAGDKQQDFLVLKLKDVFVTSYQVGGAESADTAMDQVALRFARVDYEFRPQKADGSLDAPVKGSWDVKKNAPG